MLTIHFLGNVQVERDGKLVQFATAVTQGLFAYLVMHPGHQFSRERLATLFYPEAPPQAAGQNLRQTLRRLRKGLGDSDSLAKPIILATRMTVGFNANTAVSLDTATCDHYHQLVQNETSLTMWRKVRLLEKAAALYRGEFLSDLQVESELFREWLYFEREKWAKQGMAVLGQLAELYGRLGRYEQMAAIAQRQIQLEAWREDAYQQLLRALLAQGKRAAAIAEYQKLTQILADELGIAPSAEMTQLLASEEKAVSGKAQQRKGNLAPLATPFFGRDDVLGEVETAVLDNGERLLTLLGMGGAGKSRAALQAGLRLQPYFTAGVWFVPLTSLGAETTTVDLLFDEIGRQLGIVRSGDIPPQEAVCSYLSNKECLIVLDNAEHLSDVVAEVVLALLSQTTCALICTSREPLYIQAEYRLAVSSLTDDNSIKLFNDRCQRIGNPLAAADQPLVASLCHLLEGIPLSLELAAATTVPNRLAESVAAIQASFKGLATRFRDVPTRQRSLRAVFDYSWGLLAHDEQQLLASLALFRGGFTSAAAAEIAHVTLEQLTQFADKSLVVMAAGRFGLHEQIREFVMEELVGRTAVYATTQQAYQTYYLSWLHQQTEAILSYRGKEIREQIEADLDNFRASWQFAIQAESTQLLQNAMRGWQNFIEVTHRFLEAANFYERAVAHFQQIAGAEAKRTAMRFQIHHAFNRTQLGDFDGVRDLFAQGVAVAQTHGDFELECMAVGCLVDHDLLRDETAQLSSLLRQMAQLAKRNKTATYAIMYEIYAGHYAMLEGQFAEAAAKMKRGLALARTEQLAYWELFTLHWLAEIANRQGFWAEAQTRAEEALAVMHAYGDDQYESNLLLTLSEVALNLGDSETAMTAIERAVELFEETNKGGSLALAVYKRANIHRVLGNREAARADFLAAMAYEQAHDLLGAAITAVKIAELDFQVEQFAAAREQMETGLAIVLKHEAGYELTAVTLVRLRLALVDGALDEAANLLKQADGLLDAIDIPVFRSHFWHERGHLGLAKQDWAAAKVAFTEAKAAHEALSLGWAVLEDEVGLLAVALQEGDKTAVSELLPKLTAYHETHPSLSELYRPFWVRQILRQYP
ncbi:MAG: BTAD domain-containing putative transcriptional regulator [Chloroflexota bacterium]